jgi:hypothetical protein
VKMNEFLKRIKAKAEQNRINRDDVRFKKAIALLKGKGFLDTNLPIAGVTGAKLQLKDAIWAGKNVEPRILEVLPAALLHYRKNFLGAEQLPDDLNEILRAIRNNEEKGPAFEGIPFEKMKYWANAKLKDRRTKPVNEQKMPKFLKLKAVHINKLEALVKAGKFKDQTSAIEAAIERL